MYPETNTSVNRGREKAARRFWFVNYSKLFEQPGLSDFNPVIAFLVGYAGGDLLENFYKIIIKKPVLA